VGCDNPIVLRNGGSRFGAAGAPAGQLATHCSDRPGAAVFGIREAARCPPGR
jgi:hypothetical protein